MSFFKKMPLLLFLAAVLVLLIGAVAPVAPSQDLYVTDYATSLFQEHRTLISTTSPQVEQETGIQVLVLVVKQLDGLSPEEFAQQTLAGWGSRISPDAVLLLLDRDTTSLTQLATGAAATLVESSSRTLAEDVSLSPALMKVYRQLIQDLYSALELPLNEEMAKTVGEATGGKSDAYYYLIILFVGGMLIALRGLMISRRYQKRYGKHRSRQYKSYVREIPQFDDNEDEISTIGYDD